MWLFSGWGGGQPSGPQEGVIATLRGPQGPPPPSWAGVWQEPGQAHSILTAQLPTCPQPSSGIWGWHPESGHLWGVYPLPLLVTGPLAPSASPGAPGPLPSPGLAPLRARPVSVSRTEVRFGWGPGRWGDGGSARACRASEFLRTRQSERREATGLGGPWALLPPGACPILGLADPSAPPGWAGWGRGGGWGWQVAWHPASCSHDRGLPSSAAKGAGHGGVGCTGAGPPPVGSGWWARGRLPGGRPCPPAGRAPPALHPLAHPACRAAMWCAAWARSPLSVGAAACPCEATFVSF